MAPHILRVSILGSDSIHCGFHLVPYIAHTITTSLPSSTYVLVTDTNVAAFHLDAFHTHFAAAILALPPHNRPRFLSRVIPPGENTKSRQGKADIEDWLLLNKCTRDTVIIALGGGVIGDLVGFVAATFMRGVRFVQVPTTLLAMVDSSVGGKTAIDTPHGKNLLGAFHQPAYIFIDAAFLSTLPPREFSNGMAEVVKTAAIWNEDDFAHLEGRAQDIFAAVQTPADGSAGRTKDTRSPTQDLLLKVIVGSISVKAHIVTIDERETGLRNLVNFGHTIGHAIEALLTPTILHGECVSIGMILEAELSRSLGHLSQVSVGRLVRALKAYNLPVSLTDPRIASLPAAKLITVPRLLDVMAVDKKNSGTQKKIVLLSRIGATVEPKASPVPDARIATILSDAVRVLPAIPKSPVTMTTPGSKSISNRALVLAALGRGTCRLKNLLHSDDTAVMMTALLELHGATFAWEDGGETLVVQGGEGALSIPPKGKQIYLGNAGTAARFLTTVCTLVQAPPGGVGPEGATHTEITGNARMKQRPIGPLVDALLSNGSSVTYLESHGCLPLSISPASLQGGHIQLAASVSSQYVSSLLLCAPYAREEVELELVGGAVVSQPYIDMTISMMSTFGIHVTRLVSPSGAPTNTYRIPKGTYTNPPTYSIESDASSATYPLAVAAITGTTCTVENIGSASLQGDAQFAERVLKPMGCVVTQSETSTTVTGPPVGMLKALGTIDMEEMTDAFLTASVLAAVAVTPKEGEEVGKTRILGISNQRVKECNRIRAMIDQLAKFGVQTTELPDGLEITGLPLSQLKSGASVHCYDDHRVAMAFSVLGTVVPGTVLEEKRCVEKTWPSWWDDLENKIGISVEGVELSPSASSSPLPQSTTSNPTASILLIGMRGSGKTHIGRLASHALSWPFLDADDHFASTHMPVREFVSTHGWPAFRAAETALLKSLLQTHGERCVISLGGGIVETEEAREALRAYVGAGGRVVHVKRELEEVVRYLGEEKERPAYGEPVEAVFRRREPWFEECSNFEFVNYTGGAAINGSANGNANGHAKHTATKTSTDEITRFFTHITGVHPNHADLSSNTRSYFLSLTFPSIIPYLSTLPTLTAGVDAIELRVDLLRAPKDLGLPGAYIPPLAYVAAQLAALRRASSLPVVYTVRTTSQGGAFPDNADKEALELMSLGVRMGVEYLDVEVTWPEAVITSLVQGKGATRIIASWHDWSGSVKWSDEIMKSKYELAARYGDVVKLVSKAETLADNFALDEFAGRVRAAPGAKPFIAINMGVAGQLSRVLNPTFSPVTHPLLPVKAAPGQLSLAQIHQALHLLGLLPAGQFYLLGTPIAHSMSPTIHNTAFSALGLPHTYELLETQNVGEEIKAALAGPQFGGASVTIPFKLDVIPLLDEMSEAARAIGAVNTIVPRSVDGDASRRILYGDNTDWLGIIACIRAQSPSPLAPEAGLVIGAGGTARAAIYALHHLGTKVIYIYNRTPANAAALIGAFPEANVQLLETLGGWPLGVAPSVVVGTVPASGTTLDAASGAGAVYLPSTLFASTGGVVVDMAYKPAETPLLTLAKKAEGWVGVRGVEVLLEQAYVQFELWTGRRCPREVVRGVVLEKYAASV